MSTRNFFRSVAGVVLLAAIFVPICGATHATATESAETTAVSAWVAWLQDPSPERRRIAAWALREAQPEREAATSLLEGLADPDPLTVDLSAESLKSIGASAVLPLVREVQRGERRMLKIDPILISIGRPAVPDLVSVLGPGTDRGTTVRVARILGEIGEPAVDAVEPLIRFLRESENPADLRQVSLALGKIGSAARDPLVELWADASDVQREGIQMAWAAMGSIAEPVVPHLLDSLESASSPRVRFSAARALGSIGSEAADAVEPLIRRMEDDENQSVRAYSAAALGDIGARPNRSIPALIGALRGSGDNVRRQSAAALAKFGPLALPALRASAKQGSIEERKGAMTALRQMEKAEPDVIELLIEGLTDDSTEVNEAARLGLVNFVESATPALLKTLDSHESAKVRGYSALVLGQAPGSRTTVVEALHAALSDDSLRVRQISAWSLGKHGPIAAPALPSLLICLSDPDSLVRRNAAWAIGSLERSTPELIEGLTRAAEDPDETVRDEALESLEKLRGTYRPGQTP